MIFNHRKKTHLIGKRLATVVATAMAVCVAPASAAQAPTSSQGAVSTTSAVNLNITPKRLTFDKTTRSATVYVFNQGSTPATVNISLVDRVMLPSGEIKPAEEASDDPRHKPFVAQLKSAGKMILVSPRRVVLAPGKGQTVRLRVTPPPGSASSEYRTHLTVATVPDRDVGLTADQAASVDQRQLTFRVASVFGLSIPLIIRTGAADVAGSIEDVRIERGSGGVPSLVSLVLKRTGANSLFGNVEVRSKGNVIGLARGVGVYPEINGRALTLPLSRAPRKGELIEIVFIDDDQRPGQLIASGRLAAP